MPEPNKRRAEELITWVCAFGVFCVLAVLGAWMLGGEWLAR